jgi:TP901 family phage tail tape measure protein
MAIIVPIVSAWNSTGLNKAIRDIKRAEGAFNKFTAGTAAIGASFQATGRSLTRNLTVPMALAAGAAIKTAMDFEDSFGKIEGLVGVAKADLKELQNAAKTLGPAYGQSANEAADALFFITSAGLRGKDAIDVLEKSLKASAVGLGDAKTIADLTTSAMNAYGKEILNASQATDTLTAAVRLGKIEPGELAASIGQVLPLSSALGINFNEVGAAFAAMSRTGTDAATAATQLRGIMAGLTKVTPKAERQLAEFGLSGEGLRKQLREQGLLSVLQTLTDTFGDNEVAISNVFGNVRALTGVLDLMGANVEDTNAIFAEMADSTGILDEAFGVTADTTKFQFAQAIAELKAVALEVGQVLIPVFINTVIPAIKSVAASFIGLVERFKALSPQTQDAIVKFGLLVIAAGPILLIVGKIISAVGVLGKAMAAVGSAMGIALGPVILIALAIAGLILIVVALWRESEVFRNAVTKAFESVKEAIRKVVDNVKSKLDENKASLDTLKQGFKALGDFIGKYTVPMFEVYLVTAIRVLGNTIGWIIQYVVFMINVWVRIINTIKSVIAFFGRLKDSFFVFIDAIGKANQRIKNIGTNLVEGIKDGINDAWANFKKWFTDKLGQPIQWAKKVLGISSPSKVFAKIGSDTIAGYIKGVEGMNNALDQTMSGFSMDQTVQLNGGVAAASATSGAPSLAPVYNINVNAGMGTDGAQVGREIVDAIKRYERTSGPVFASA